MRDYSSFSSSFAEYFRYGSGISVWQWLSFFLMLAGVTLLIIWIIDFIQRKLLAREEVDRPLSVHEFHSLLLNEMGFDEQTTLQVLAALRQQSVRRILELFESRNEQLWKFRVEDAFDEHEENALADLHSKLKRSHDLAKTDFAQLYPRLLPIHDELLVLKTAHDISWARKHLKEYCELHALIFEEECFHTQIGDYYSFRLYPR